MLRFQSKVQKQWLGVLDASEKLSTLDFFTLVLLYRVAVQQKRVLGAVKKHVKKGSLTRSLLEVPPICDVLEKRPSVIQYDV